MSKVNHRSKEIAPPPPTTTIQQFIDTFAWLSRQERRLFEAQAGSVERPLVNILNAENGDKEIQIPTIDARIITDKKGLVRFLSTNSNNDLNIAAHQTKSNTNSYSINITKRINNTYYTFTISNNGVQITKRDENGKDSILQPEIKEKTAKVIDLPILQGNSKTVVAGNDDLIYINQNQSNKISILPDMENGNLNYQLRYNANSGSDSTKIGFIYKSGNQTATYNESTSGNVNTSGCEIALKKPNVRELFYSKTQSVSPIVRYDRDLSPSPTLDLVSSNPGTTTTQPENPTPASTSPNIFTSNPSIATTGAKEEFATTTAQGVSSNPGTTTTQPENPTHTSTSPNIFTSNPGIATTGAKEEFATTTAQGVSSNPGTTTTQPENPTPASTSPNIFTSNPDIAKNPQSNNNTFTSTAGIATTDFETSDSNFTAYTDSPINNQTTTPTYSDVSTDYTSFLTDTSGNFSLPPTNQTNAPYSPNSNIAPYNEKSDSRMDVIIGTGAAIATLLLAAVLISIRYSNKRGTLPPSQDNGPSEYRVNTKKTTNTQEPDAPTSTQPPIIPTSQEMNEIPSIQPPVDGDAAATAGNPNTRPQRYLRNAISRKPQEADQIPAHTFKQSHSPRDGGNISTSSSDSNSAQPHSSRGEGSNSAQPHSPRDGGSSLSSDNDTFTIDGENNSDANQIPSRSPTPIDHTQSSKIQDDSQIV